MRLTVFVEPQFGATYDDQLRIARHAEACGFDGFFRSDHFLTMGGDGLPGPTDAWVTLAGLAAGDPADPARHDGHARRRSGCPARSRSPSPRSTP